MPTSHFFNLATNKRHLLIIALFLMSPAVIAQSVTALDDLSDFKDPGSTWRISGAVTADLNKPNTLYTTSGTGVLVNLPEKKNPGKDLFTKAEFGDMDLELEYMMASKSNSGIYLHGRYELQLEDSWGTRIATAGRNGGIYERWDESRPQGNKGYEGHAPRQNASRAPGLWQTLKVSFQAPRFDPTGKKVSPAKLLKVELNGVIIHEDLELSGPTRGSVGPEKATGPLRFQGDHGAVAFRNIKVTDFGQARPEGEKSRRNRVYPILVQASDNPVFRSFMDLPTGKRVVHAVSVASSANVHYTYDTDNGTLVQAWRGGFLDATPMWYSRGDGSSRPLGAVQRFGDPTPTIAKLNSSGAAWIADTTGTGFRSLGYRLDAENNPVFLYRINGANVTDAIRALSSGEGISRAITVSGSQQMYARLAEANDIKQINDELYMIGDHEYYVRITTPRGQKPVIRNSNGKKELLMSVAGEVNYEILF